MESLWRHFKNSKTTSNAFLCLHKLEISSFWPQMALAYRLVLFQGPQKLSISSSNPLPPTSPHNVSARIKTSVADPNPDSDPPDPRVFGSPGSGSTNQRYGSGSGSCSGSGSGSFYHHAKIVRKTLIPTMKWLFLTFCLWKMMQMELQKVISRKNCVKKLVFCWHLEGQWRK
jgi:hypothetical protein